jgi:hypothetical protein
LSTNITQNFTTNATKKLPRTFGLPFPAPLPRNFSKEYSDECRVIEAGWNILWQKIPYEEFYTVLIERKFFKWSQKLLNFILKIF